MIVVYGILCFVGFVLWALGVYIFSHLMTGNGINNLFILVFLVLYSQIPAGLVGFFLYKQNTIFGIHWAVPFVIVLVAWGFVFKSFYSNAFYRMIGIKQAGYSTSFGKAYHNGKHLKDVDGETFEIVLSKNSFREQYAKDKNVVLYKGKKQELMDPGSFEIVSYDITRDKNHVYFKQKKVDSVDMGSVVFDGSNCYRDKNSFYFESFRLSKVPNDFRWIKGYCKRGVSAGKIWKVYEHRGELNEIPLDYQGNEANTIYDKALGLIRDGNDLYFTLDEKVRKVEGFDIQSFEKLDSEDKKIRTPWGYYKDKDYVYYLNHRPSFEFFKVDVSSVENFKLHPRRDKRPGDATDGTKYFENGRVVSGK